MQIKLRFGELLRQRGITPNRLALHGKNLSRNTVYGLANPTENRVRLDLDVLASAMSALEEITGESISITDVLEVIESAEEPVNNAALAAALNNAKPLNLDALDALTDPNAEDPTAWLESSRKQSRKELKQRAQAVEKVNA
jgi:hypothetical protein